MFMHFVSIFAECAGLGTPLSLAALAGVSPALPQGEPSYARGCRVDSGEANFSETLPDRQLCRY